MEVILASQSPRRKELLKRITEDFQVRASGAEEKVPDEIPSEQRAEFLAVKKAAAVSAGNPEALVIGCDTVVLLDGEVFGKPKSPGDSVRMLASLSGRTHQVATGVCLMIGKLSCSFTEVTEVEFYPLEDSEIAAYVESGEPVDKAGGYGIQGKGCLLVKGIRGDYFNVMGLPVARLSREWRRFLRQASLLELASDAGQVQPGKAR